MFLLRILEYGVFYTIRRFIHALDEFIPIVVVTEKLTCGRAVAAGIIRLHQLIPKVPSTEHSFPFWRERSGALTWSSTWTGRSHRENHLYRIQLSCPRLIQTDFSSQLSTAATCPYRLYNRLSR